MDIELSLMTETVAQAAPVEPVCVSPQLSLRRVLEVLRRGGQSVALVCRDGALVGVFTERDALRVMAQNIDLSTSIEQMMTPRPITVHAREKIGNAVQKMATGGYRRLPIVDDAGRPVGLVHVSGIVHYLVEHFPKTIYNLPPVPHPCKACPVRPPCRCPLQGRTA